jgi:hypothetical protein
MELEGIAVFRTTRRQPLFWARLIQSTPTLFSLDPF